MSESTHFGYREVPQTEKTDLVKAVFHSVAEKYDLMNDLMSFGMHHLWKRYFIDQANIQKGQSVLDVASGTGDIALALAKRVGETGSVIATDINSSMLAKAYDRFVNAGFMNRITCVEANAEALPFAKNTFDRITIAFGLRNVTNQKAALLSMKNALNPGGKLLVLEFSKPVLALLSKAYDAYSFHVIPKIGEWVLNDRASYQYLVESIRMHPNQDTLKQMMEEVGLEEVRYTNLSGGIVAIHEGWKY